MLEKVVEMKKRGLGPQHPNVAIAMSNLANCLGYLNKHEEKAVSAFVPLCSSSLLLGRKCWKHLW